MLSQLNRKQLLRLHSMMGVVFTAVGQSGSVVSPRRIYLLSVCANDASAVNGEVSDPGNLPPPAFINSLQNHKSLLCCHIIKWITHYIAN